MIVSDVQLVFGEIAFTRFGHPRYFRGKAFTWSFSYFKAILRNNEWNVSILNAHVSNLVVEPALDKFPHFVRPQDVAARNFITRHHFGKHNDIGVYDCGKLSAFFHCRAFTSADPALKLSLSEPTLFATASGIVFVVELLEILRESTWSKVSHVFTSRMFPTTL
jgi:hypothetical protein